MNLRHFLSFLVLVPALAGSAAERDLAQASDIASRSLATLRKLAKGTNLTALGFRSPSEVDAAAIGQPISVYMVRLDELRAYQTATDPNSLLKPLDKVIFPVVANKQVLSSIVVEKVNSVWKPTNFGGPLLARALTKTLENSSQTNHVAASAHFAVQVPALNAYFIGYRAEGKLLLASVFDDPKMQLTEGTALPAEEIFSRLAPIAQRYNGLPL